MRRIEPKDLPRVYREQLFANEVMLLPYYVAAQNIEHEYYDLTGEYEPFEGLCFVDTLELAEAEQRHAGLHDRGEHGPGRAPEEDADQRHHRQPAVQRRARSTRTTTTRTASTRSSTGGSPRPIAKDSKATS